MPPRHKPLARGQQKLPFAKPRSVPELDPNRQRTVVDCRPVRSRLPTREKVDKFFQTNTEKRKRRDAERAESQAIWEDDSHFFEDDEGNERLTNMSGLSTSSSTFHKPTSQITKSTNSYIF